MALTKISTAMISQSAAAVDLNVDAGTFYVDTTNNRVGVGGKTDPDTPLHVIGTVTATLFAGSGASLTNIPNSALTNSSITINSTAVSLGGSLTLTTANIAENTNLYYTDARADARIAAADTDDLSEGSSNLYYTDARVDARVSGGSLGNITTTGYIRGPSSFTIDPAAHGDNTGTVVIAGNLQVDGTTTTINSTTLTVDDKNITLASGSANAGAASGAGFTVDIGSGTNPAITYDGTNDEWDFNKPLNVTGNVIASNLYVADDIGHSGDSDTYISFDNNTHTYYAGGTRLLDFAPGSVIFNEGGGDVDFRVEGVGSSHALFVQGSDGKVGIGTTSPAYPLEIANNSALSFAYQRTGVSAKKWGFDSDNAATYWVNITDNVRSLTLLNGGNVGIGTMAPYAKLSVKDGTNINLGIKSGQTDSTAVMLNAYNDAVTANIPMEFRASKFAFQNGNVGIGTGSPSGITNGKILEIKNSSTGNGTHAQITLTGSNGHTNLLLASGDDSTGGDPVISSTANHAIRFGHSTNSTFSGFDEHMRIADDGRVGIGTTAPNTNVQIYHATDDVSINVNHGTGGSYPKKSGISFGAISTSLGGDATFTGGAGIQAINTAASNNLTEMAFFTTSGGSPTERMRIDSSGNVGIGTTDPFTTGGASKLTVAGILAIGASNADMSYIRRQSTGNYAWQTYDNNNTGSIQLQPYGGNVGIGTTSPSHTLHTSTSATGVYIQREISSNAANLSEFNSHRSLIIKNRTGGSFLMFGGTGSRTDIQATDGAGTPTAKNIALNPFGGNVGIGTDTPLSESNIVSLQVGSSSIAASQLVLDDNDSNGPWKIRSNQSLIFYDNSTERMRIDSSGDVGIGVVPATHARLTLGGTAASYSSSLVFDNNTAGGAEFFMLASDNTWSAGANKFLMGHGSPSSSAVDIAIDADGKVGIGTASPSSKLHVKHGDIRLEGNAESGQDITFTITNDNSGNEVEAGLIRFIDTGGGQSNRGAAIASYMPTADTGDLRFYTSAGADRVERMRIYRDGNVGIGTTAPTTPLSIRKVHGSGYGSGIDMLDFKAYYPPNYDTETSKASIFVGTSDKHTLNTHGGYLAFKVNSSGYNGANGATSLVEYMRIEKDGNVGIGTTSPDTLLHLSNNGTTPATIRIERNDTTISDTNIYGGIEFEGQDGSAGSAAGIRGKILGVAEGVTGEMALTFETAAGYGSSTERMRIDSSGNVGIGTTNPTSALDIRGAGSSGAQKNTIAFGTTGWGQPTAPNAALDGAVKLALFEGGTQKVQIGMDANARLWLASAGSGAQGVDIYTGASNTVAPSLRLRVDQAGLTNAYGGVSTPLVTTNDIKATGAGGVSIQTDEGTKRIEVFDNGKITFNNLIYQSGINNNTINSGYNADSEDSDMWINYRGYNDGHTRFRDFRIGDGKGNPIAFFDGSEMTANIHTLKVHTGSFRAVGTLPSTAGMALTGVGLGQLSNYAHAQFSGSAGGYIDFAEPNVDWSGRIIYTHSDDSMVFYSAVQPTMYLTQTGATVRNGPNANQGKLTFSTQSTAYNIIGGNYWGYTGINSGGHIRLGSNNGEQMRLGAGVSTGNMALGLIGVTGVNSEAAIHGKSSDATLVLTNTDLTSASAWGWTGRGGRVLTSNGTSWANDGKDAALVIGSAQSVAATRGQGVGIILHNESSTDNTHSPGIYFTNKSNSGGYNTAYGYIMGKKTGTGVDSNWSTGEIHMDTAGTRTGTATRTAYMDDIPAFKIDNAGDVTMPYKAYAYGTINGNPTSITNNYGIALTTTRYQNCTPTTNSSHGPGITITKAGFYILNMSLLYSPSTYTYIGWCVNGSQIHHWHSNHAVSSNHDAVSQIGRYLNIGDHVSIENSNQSISTIYGNSHSAWYIAKIG